MVTGQMKYDIYETLLKEMDEVIEFVELSCKKYTKNCICSALRVFIFKRLDLQWLHICEIITEDIARDYKDPLRVYFNTDLYLETSENCTVH